MQFDLDEGVAGDNSSFTSASGTVPAALSFAKKQYVVQREITVEMQQTKQCEKALATDLDADERVQRGCADGVAEHAANRERVETRAVPH